MCVGNQTRIGEASISAISAGAVAHEAVKGGLGPCAIRVWREFPNGAITGISAPARRSVKVAGCVEVHSAVGAVPVGTAGEVVDDLLGELSVRTLHHFEDNARGWIVPAKRGAVEIAGTIDGQCALWTVHLVQRAKGILQFCNAGMGRRGRNEAPN